MTVSVDNREQEKVVHHLDVSDAVYYNSIN